MNRRYRPTPTTGNNLDSHAGGDFAAAHIAAPTMLLARGAAHDVRNLITIVQGNLDVALRLAGPGSNLAHWIDTAHEAANRAIDVTESWLRLAQGEGAAEQVVDAVAVWRDAAAAIARLLPQPIRVRIEIAEPCHACLLATPVELRQVLLNLVLNARDAMPDGGTLWIRVMAGEGGALVQLEVEDEGVGLTDETLTRMFDDGYSTRAGGSGLGLALVRGIVERRGGAVEACSSSSGGAILTVRLPTVVPM